MNPPALVVLVVRPQIAQPRHDLLGEELARVPRLPVRHVAVVEQAEQMADAQSFDALLELLAHRLRAARDDEALVHQLLPREVLEDLLPRARQLRERAVLHRRHRAVARRIGEGREDVQAAVEAVQAVLGVQPLGFGQQLTQRSWLYLPSKAKGSSLAQAFMIISCASRYLSRVRAGIWP